MPSDVAPDAPHQMPSEVLPEGLSEVDLLLRLARRWRRLGAEEVAGAEETHGAEPALTPHQERGLLALARMLTQGGGAAPGGDHGHGHPPGVRVSRLAAQLGIAPRSATEVADALETAGLVTRSPDPTDRRAVLLSLTGQGQQRVGAVRERRRAVAEAAVAALSDQDRAELRRLLGALLQG